MMDLKPSMRLVKKSVQMTGWRKMYKSVPLLSLRAPLFSFCCRIFPEVFQNGLKDA
jgi:hypothetical protein